jgi:hypothetical protein
MRFPRLLLLVMLAAASTASAQNPGDDIFAGTKIHTLSLRFSQPRYWDSLTFYYSEGKERTLAATAVINGVVFDSVGVRFKGNSSYSHPNNKKPFTITLDEYRRDQRWDGVKSIHLNNGYSDPTMIREKVHLDFCRDAGIPAPRANFVQLALNDTAWGFYTMVEHVDKGFVESRFGTRNGYLFKAVDAFGGGGPGSQPMLSDFKWYGAGIPSYLQRYEQKTGDSIEAWSGLVAFLDMLNNDPAVATSLPDALDLTGFERAFGTDILFGNLDSYVGSGRNFYAYIDSASGRLRWIVWDANMSFGTYPQQGTTVETLSLTYVSSSTSRPLIGKIYASPQLKAGYLQTFCTLVGRYFSSERLDPLIDTLAAQVRPYVEADKRKMYTLAQFDANVEADITEQRGQSRIRKPGLKSFVAARSASVASQLATLGVSCSPSSNPAAGVVINELMTDNDIITDPAGDFDDWIELYNTTDAAIELSGASLTDNFDAPAKWQFPAGTTIAPHGYLIVWADEDGDQEGLHASFKLTADGERVMLSSSDGAVLDSLSYGAQTTNTSLARVPNGTGPFTVAEPTFGRTNDVSTATPTGVDIAEIILAQNRPNPVGASTTFELRLARGGLATLSVTDMLGNVVATPLAEYREAGTHAVLWHPRDLAAGSYLYTLRAGGVARTRLLVIDGTSR